MRRPARTVDDRRLPERPSIHQTRSPVSGSPKTGVGGVGADSAARRSWVDGERAARNCVVDSPLGLGTCAVACGDLGRGSYGPTGASTRCARPPLRSGPSDDTPAVPPLREQLWALRPGLDGGGPAVDDFTPDARRAVGARGLDVPGHGAQQRPRTRGFFWLGRHRTGSNPTHTCLRRATCKTLGVAARLSPPILRGEHPLFWISTACSGPEGPAASQETENEGIDVFSTERRDTGGCLTPVGHRNWMGVCRRRVGYVTRRRSWSAVSANMPNMQWHITFAAPRTRTWRPPNSSLRRPLTRSPAVRSL